jgi:predicted PhzF superfamily epimerase YddE/YHI9
MITSAADEPGVDFVSRYFASAFGIDEDPATGSTHSCLGPFWSRRLNKSTFVVRQVSERGGMLKVAMDGDRVRLGRAGGHRTSRRTAGVTRRRPVTDRL